MPNFTYFYEIHFTGQIAITADNQYDADIQFNQIQLPNLETNASAPAISITNVTSDSTPSSGTSWEPY